MVVSFIEVPAGNLMPTDRKDTPNSPPTSLPGALGDSRSVQRQFGFGVRARIAHSQGHEARLFVSLGSPAGWAICGCGGAAGRGRPGLFFRAGPGRVGPGGDDDAAWAAAVLHPLPQDGRTVRRLRGRLSASLFEPELAGHRRYAHIAALRCDAVLPDLLGMKKIVSEDAIRRAFKAVDETEGAVWLRRHLQDCVEPLLSEPWILDVDTTIKPLYGHQEGAVLG